MKILINRCYGGFGLSKKAIDLLASRGFDINAKMNEIEFRMHPMVIQTVEELGEAANGEFSKIKIIEFCLEDLIQIKDHDGMERLIINNNEI